MSLTEQDVQEFIGTATDVSAHLAEALALINDFVGNADVPDEVLDAATLRVCQHLYKLAQAPTGAVPQQFAGPDGIQATPVRLARDPLTPAYPTLRRWVLPF